MIKNEETHEMYAQILNLRSAGIACATAIHCFPPCVTRPEDYDGRCSEARAALEPINEDMKDLLLSVRIALAAVFNADPGAWDSLWELNKDSNRIERDMAKLGKTLYSDQDEYIRICGELSPI